MLDSIFNILKQIGDFFTSVGQFIVKLFNDLVYVIELVGDTVADIPKYLGWLPSELLALLLPIFAIVVVYKVLGRD